MNPLQPVGVKLGTQPAGAAYLPDGDALAVGDVVWFAHGRAGCPGAIERDPADRHGWVQVRVDRFASGGTVLVSHYP